MFGILSFDGRSYRYSLSPAKFRENIGLILIASVGLYPYNAFCRSKPELGHKFYLSPLIQLLLNPLMKYMFHRLGFPKGVSVRAMRYVLHAAHDFSFQEHSDNIVPYLVLF